MANRARALGLDLINTWLSEYERERGFTMRVQYVQRLFRSFYHVSAFDGHSYVVSIKFYNLSDAICAARDIEKLLKKSREHVAREAIVKGRLG